MRDAEGRVLTVRSSTRGRGCSTQRASLRQSGGLRYVRVDARNLIARGDCLPSCASTRNGRAAPCQSACRFTPRATKKATMSGARF